MLELVSGSRFASGWSVRRVREDQQLGNARNLPRRAMPSIRGKRADDTVRYAIARGRSQPEASAGENVSLAVASGCEAFIRVVIYSSAGNAAQDWSPSMRECVSLDRAMKREGWAERTWVRQFRVALQESTLMGDHERMGERGVRAKRSLLLAMANTSTHTSLFPSDFASSASSLFHSHVVILPVTKS